MASLDYKYQRESRLLNPFDFAFVFDKAVAAPSPHITILARKNHFDNPRLGITVAKKKVKLASDRNRIKRITRESFRLNKHRLPNIDIIVIGKKGVDSLSNDAFFRLLEKLWNKIIHRCKSL